MTNPYRAMCAELLAEYEDSFITSEPSDDPLVQRARALLAEPVAEGPTVEELVNHVGWFADEACLENNSGDIADSCRELIARWGRPAVVLVPEPTDEALANFTAWFCRNYPGPDTLIHRPEWHAPKVFRAAADAIARWGNPAPQHDPWKEVLLDALVCNFLLEKEHENDPKKALNDLIVWEKQLVTDPLINPAPQPPAEGEVSE